MQERTAALRAANRELEAFSYTVAHDLRGPLDAVQGMVYILEGLDRENREGERREILEQLRQATRNMASLIDDLLNLSRATTAALKKQPVDMTTLATRIAEDLKGGEPDRRVEFMIAHLPPVEADEGLMKVALDNLIRNAWKYTSRHKSASIEFGALNRRGEIVYYVRDDGAGFDPKLNDQLFQRPSIGCTAGASFRGPELVWQRSSGFWRGTGAGSGRKARWRRAQRSSSR